MRWYVGYEMVGYDEVRSAKLAMIISFPTSASGINFLLETSSYIILIMITIMISPMTIIMMLTGTHH